MPYKTLYKKSGMKFYRERIDSVITYAFSNKMKQIESNPIVAIAGEWFTAHGKDVRLGYFGKPENTEIAGD